jgi:hypothetical protein
MLALDLPALRKNRRKVSFVGAVAQRGLSLI